MLANWVHALASYAKQHGPPQGVITVALATSIRRSLGHLAGRAASPVGDVPQHSERARCPTGSCALAHGAWQHISLPACALLAGLPPRSQPSRSALTPKNAEALRRLHLRLRCRYTVAAKCGMHLPDRGSDGIPISGYDVEEQT